MQIKMLLHINREAFPLSNCLFYIPNKSSQAKHRAIFVELMKLIEQRIYLSVFNNRDNCVCESGPRMASIVGFSMLAASSFHTIKGCESSTVALSQDIDYFLIMSLVECYEY